MERPLPVNAGCRIVTDVRRENCGKVVRFTHRRDLHEGARLATCGFNEGKVCDAVLRHIESRKHALRTDCSSPEKDGHPHPIELVCTIGEQRFALEHTGVEPFEGFVRLQVNVQKHFRPLQERLSSRLPTDSYYQLHIPLKATQGLKGAKMQGVQDALATWIEVTAPTLPMAKPGRFVVPIVRIAPPGVPFPVSLHRRPREGESQALDIVQEVGDDLEEQRRARIARSCAAKYPKLHAWKAMGARTILVLEEGDIQLTSPIVVAESVLKAETTITSKPDEIYLVSTVVKPWWVYCIRVDEKSFFDNQDDGERRWRISPDTLEDATGSLLNTVM